MRISPLLFALMIGLFQGLAVSAEGNNLPRATPKRQSSATVAQGEPDFYGRDIFQVLVGEFALRGKDINLAGDAWGDLAQRSRDPRAYERAVEILGAGRRYEQALMLVEQWLEEVPESGRARQLQSSLMVMANRLDDLAPKISAELQKEPDALAYNLLQLNRLLMRHTDKKAVLKLIRQIVEPYPTLPEARLALSEAAMNAGAYDLAVIEVDEAQRIKPDWELAMLLKAQLLTRQGSGPAIDALDAFVQRNPEALDARLALARLQLTERRFEAARVHFDRLIKVMPNRPEVIYPLAMLALQQGDIELGKSQLEHLLETGFQQRSTVQFFLGQVEEERQNPEAAMARYRQVEDGEQYLNARNRLVALLQKQGKLSEALQVLQETHASTPSEQAQRALSEAVLLRESKRLDEAGKVLEKALQQDPDHPELLYESAMLAEKQNRISVMEKQLRHLLKLQPDNAHALNALGYSLADRGLRLQEAEKLIQKAIALAPEDPFIMDSLGWVQFRLGHLKEAEQILSKAYAQKQDPEIAAHLTEVLWQAGKKQEARQLMDAARQANPDHEILQPLFRKLWPGG